MFAMEEEKSKKLPKLWYEFYGKTLSDHWKNMDNKANSDLYKIIPESQEDGKNINKNRKKIMGTLYQILSQLHKDSKTSKGSLGCIPKTVADNFTRQKSIPIGLLNGVLLLLVETDFYLSFFDVGMTPRLELFNSERTSKKLYEYMRLLISKDDEFWGRWLNLHCIRYESDLWDDDEKEKLYNKYHTIYKKYDYPSMFFVEELKKMKMINRDMHKRLKQRIEFFNHFFCFCFYLTYNSWIKYSGRFNLKERESQKKELLVVVEQRMKNSFEALRRYFIEESTGTFYKRSPFSKELFDSFYFDFRIHQLYYEGTLLIGSEVNHFRELDENQRNTLLIRGEEFKNKLQPRYNDNTQYRIWYLYYVCLHQQRVAEHELCNESFHKALELFNEANQILNEIEQIASGGFYRILLKVKYQRRCIFYITNSLEAYLLEKQLEDPYNIEYKLNEARHKSKDNTFQNLQKWMEEIRADILK